MEILIIGGIFVALMAYASTRIKKSAAQAFEREEIETDEFYIVKPENFINPVSDDASKPFIAHTKDVGTDAAEKLRRASIVVRAVSDGDFERLRQSYAANGETLVAEETGDLESGRMCYQKTESVANGVAVENTYKIIESRRRRKVYVLRIVVVGEYADDYAAAVDEILRSLTIK